MRRFVLASIGTVYLTFAGSSDAQPICIPGTTICLQQQGNGQGQVGGQASGQAGPNGAQGQAQGQGGAQGSSPPRPPPPPPPPPTVAPPPPPPPAPPPPTPSKPPAPTPTPSSADYGSPGGHSEVFLGLALGPRVGFTSGWHGGGGLVVEALWSGWGVEMDALVFHGGTVPRTDIDLFFGPVWHPFEDYVGADGLVLSLTGEIRWGFKGRAGQLVSLGGDFGVGYELSLSRSVVWRLADARFFALGRTDSGEAQEDRLGNKYDLGILFLSGIGFK